MSHEKNEAQRERSKFAMQKRRKLETKEQSALAKDKHKEKQRLSKRRKHQAKTEEETKSNNEKKRLDMNRKRQAETVEQTELPGKMTDLQRRESVEPRLRSKQSCTGKITN